MSKFNTVRWLLAGLAMAVIIYLFEMVANTAVLGKDWEAWSAISAKAFAPPDQTASLVHWGLQTMVAGLAGAFIYAASRDWVGKALTAGLIAGFVVWAAGWLGMTFDKMAMGMEPAKMMHVNLLFALVACLLGGVAVSYIYKDKASST